MFNDLKGNQRFAAISAVHAPDIEDREAAVYHLILLARETPDVMVEVERMVRQYVSIGDKTRRIECIKKAREMTGLGLKEAKDLVDRLWPY